MITSRLFNDQYIDTQYINTHSYDDNLNYHTLSENVIKPNVKNPLEKSVRIAFDCLVLVFLIVGPGIVYGG